MMRKHGLLSLAAAALLGACAATGDPAPAEPPGEMAADAAGMTAEEQAQWDAYMKLASPGEHHAHIAPMVGRFGAQTSMWMAPGAPPEETTGFMDNTWVLGGRFLQQKLAGEAMGMPFEGMGLMGYDNHQERYVSTWADSMGTMIMPLAYGSCSNNGKLITLEGDMFDPMSGTMAHYRDVFTIRDGDHHTFEMFRKDPGQEEFKTLEVRYTRVQG